MDNLNLLEAQPPASNYEKLKKVNDYVSIFQNFYTCLRLRNGIRMNVRSGTPDISVIWEVFKGGAYASTEGLVREAGAESAIIDLGANIGSYTLRCASLPENVEVHSYEPGPQNADVLRTNLALNPQIASRIHFFQEAVARTSGTAYWQFDAKDPGCSALSNADQGVEVKTVSFRDVLARCRRPLALVKIDIEGGEYGLLDGTEKSDWQGVPAVLAELHPDPAGASSPEKWLQRMNDYGFKKQQREFCTVALLR
jgi:FkbM family methyltransferase